MRAIRISGTIVIANHSQHHVARGIHSMSGASSDASQFRSSAGLAYLALACVGMFTTPALAEEADEAAEKPDIVVTGTHTEPGLASDKIIAPLLDTPQTVTVI